MRHIFFDLMGRIKTKSVKRITEELISLHAEEFSEKFEDNKPIVEKYTDIPSKKLRNIITGYVTRRAKSKEEL
jgi:small subunit ribosomal protein S17e